MVNLSDIYPLTGFLRNHKAHLERLRESGRPEVLTVNGRASVVVQDAEAYQNLLETIDRLESEEILQERLRSLDRDEPGIPAKKVLADIQQALDAKGNS